MPPLDIVVGPNLLSVDRSISRVNTGPVTQVSRMYANSSSSYGVVALMFAAMCANTAAMCSWGSKGRAMNSRHACNSQNITLTGLWCRTVNRHILK